MGHINSSIPLQFLEALVAIGVESINGGKQGLRDLPWLASRTIPRTRRSGSEARCNLHFSHQSGRDALGNHEAHSQHSEFDRLPQHVLLKDYCRNKGPIRGADSARNPQCRVDQMGVPIRS